MHDRFFDTVLVRVPGRAAQVVAAAREGGVHLRRVDDDHVGVSVGEDVTEAALGAVREAFGVELGPRGRLRARLGDLSGSERTQRRT